LALAVSGCGRYALEVFALGTLLSLAAWIVLRQMGTSAALEFAVSALGVASMAYAARYLSGRRADRAAATEAV
jgi:hypothetical protein